MVKKIAVLRAGALGDAVLTLPLFKAIRLKFPDSKITAIGSSPLVNLLRDSPLADEAHSMDDGSFSKFFTNGVLPEEWLCRLRGTDIAYNLIDDETLSENLRAAGAEVIRRVSLHGLPGRMSDRILSVMGDDLPLDFPGIPELFLSDADLDFADEFLTRNKLDGAAMAVHPGSGSIKKNWSPLNFAKIADTLSRDFRVVLVEGEADGEAVEGFLKHYPSGNIARLRNASVRQLAAVVKKCALYIGNDSGVSHLAAASGAPSVCVFGPTDPGVWAPRGERVITVRNRFPCAPCGRERRAGCNSLECLQIEPEAVLRAVRRILG